eukprot:652553-Amphidinium_carterae.1
MEQDTGKKPDHVAISLEFRLDLVSKGYRGQKSYETAERTEAHEVDVEYGRARQLHLARWSTPLAAKDVEQLWDLWCRAAEQALGLPALSRGKLLLSQQQLLEKVPDDEAVATAQQQDTVVTLKRKLLDTGACTFFEWPQFLGAHPPTAEAQLTSLDAWVTGRKKRLQAERTASWRTYVKEMWDTSPKKIFKWIRGTAAVWDLAILSEEGYALSPDQATQAELEAWSKLWQPGRTTFPDKATSQSSWGTGDLCSVIRHCPLGKARGVDRWSIAELRLLPDTAISDLANFLKVVEATGAWPHAIKEMLYLQLPKEGARDAGERRPIALLPQVYRLWCALCRRDVKAWRARCTGRGEVPVGRGALDETFDLAFDTEQITAAGKPQAGIFLD